MASSRSSGATGPRSVQSSVTGTREPRALPVDPSWPLVWDLGRRAEHDTVDGVRQPAIQDAGGRQDGTSVSDACIVVSVRSPILAGELEQAGWSVPRAVVSRGLKGVAMRSGGRRFRCRVLSGAVSAISTIAFGVSQAAATAPPDSPAAATLDDERQTIFDDMTSLGEMMGRPLDPVCLSGLLAEFPGRDLEYLAFAVRLRIDMEQLEPPPGNPLLGYPQPPLLPDVADFAYDSITCIRGDADGELLDAAVARVMDDNAGDGLDVTCVEAVLSTLADGMLVATAEGRQLTSAELEELTPDEVQSALEGSALLQMCGPDGRDQIGAIMGLPVSPTPVDVVTSVTTHS